MKYCKYGLAYDIVRRLLPLKLCRLNQFSNAAYALHTLPNSKWTNFLLVCAYLKNLLTLQSPIYSAVLTHSYTG